ncbi:MAG: hypothetical protein ACE5IW_07650 [bacterium]
MSTNKEIISIIHSLSLSDRITVMEEILKSIRTEIRITKSNKKEDKYENIRRRRKSFKVKAINLGGDVVVDRDEIYSERGI